MSITCLSDQLGILPPRVASSNHFCDSILGPSESPLPARRSQGASMLELNSFAFWQPCHLFQIWILCLAQHQPVSTVQSNLTKEKGRDGKFSFLSFCPMAVTHPSTNQSQRCLTSVISRELVCQRGYGIAPCRDIKDRISEGLLCYSDFGHSLMANVHYIDKWYLKTMQKAVTT